jgi:hypothetical protein
MILSRLLLLCYLAGTAVHSFHAVPSRVYTSSVANKIEGAMTNQSKSRAPSATTKNEAGPSHSMTRRTTPQEPLSRRNAFQISVASLVAGSTTVGSYVPPATAAAGKRASLNDSLYRILRVREATLQETRLIKNGTFKDVQRNNVKLAIRFMVENYRLNDAFVGASSYLPGDVKLAAVEVGQSAVSNLYTILEYFDAGDVENIKVTSLGSDKEELVLKGLDATKRKIDDFINFFPTANVEEVSTLIAEENRLNAKEFDDPALGQILNMPKS